MVFIICFCLFIVFLGCLSSLGKIKYGLEAAFILIIIFSAFRYNFGNDYPIYRNAFLQISKISDVRLLFQLFDGPFDKYQGSEVGWVLLNWLFKSIGFEGLIIFTSIVTNIVYYKFIKTYVPQRWYWLALFTYIFNTSLFFVPLSMMRQSCGMVLFVFAFKYISEKRIFISLFLILIAVFFHKSAFVLFPFALLGYLSSVNGKYIAIAFVSLFFAFMLTKDLTAEVVDTTLQLEAFGGYETYFDIMEAGESFGLGFVSRLLTFFVPFLFYLIDTKRNQFSNRLILIFAAIPFIIAPFTLIMGFLGRIGYYFSIYNIVAVPLLYQWIKEKFIRDTLLILYIAYILYSYREFFAMPVWKSFTQYQTIFG